MLRTRVGRVMMTGTERQHIDDETVDTTTLPSGVALATRASDGWDRPQLKESIQGLAATRRKSDFCMISEQQRRGSDSRQIDHLLNDTYISGT